MNKNIFEKMQLIQAKLKVPKSQFNSFGKYNYRSLEDITEAVKPLLIEIGAFISITDEVVLIGERYYVKAVAKLTDGSQEINATGYAREPMAKKGMDESQITGAASSYARKYAMNGLLAIDDTKDPDATNTHGANEKNKAGKKTNAPTPKTTQVNAKKQEQNEIVDQAFFNFQTENESDLAEGFAFSKELFIEAIIKHFKNLPTNKASVSKITTTIKPAEVMFEIKPEAA